MMVMDMFGKISAVKRDYLLGLAKEGKRVDGRGFDEYRKITIERNIIKNAEGSAKVKIGNTMVMAGIKLEIGEPYPDSPEEGTMTTSVELPPLASPEFEPGPPTPDAIEIARVIDRGIRESEYIHLDKLVVEPGEKVWIVFIDIHVLDYDGNLFDAGSLAASVALQHAVVPNERYGFGDNVPLPVGSPISSFIPAITIVLPIFTFAEPSAFFIIFLSIVILRYSSKPRPSTRFPSLASPSK